jgi:peptide/nickel transport system permease protein
VGFAAAIIAATIGAAIGIVAGYYGGRTDNVIMRGVDMLMAFPYILLALAIVAALGPGLMNALIAVAAVNIPFFARNIRGITVGIANKEFVDAAKLAGMSDAKDHPDGGPAQRRPVIVIAMSTTGRLDDPGDGGLSFLGLGSQPPQADLGSMLGEARSALITNPHTSIVPGVMILIIVMAINLLGDGVRDALDPRLKSGALSRPMPATLVNRTGPSRRPTDDDLLALAELKTQFHVKDRVYKAVGGVDLSLKPGECVGLIGESGSGKSVTALSVMGLVASPPGVITGGAVFYKGEDLSARPTRCCAPCAGGGGLYLPGPAGDAAPALPVGDQLIEAVSSHRRISRDEGRRMPSTC